MALQPPPSVQKELYKLYSVLVHIVLAAPVEFSVVSPHDFIEALSWSNSVGGNEARVIRRLREQTISPKGGLKKLLVPFSFNAEVVFLGVVDLGGPVIQIFDQRTQEDLRKGVKGDGSDVWRFINTLVPDQCPPMTAWNIFFAKTVQGPVSMSDLGDDEAPEVNKFERDVELRSVLPFFFEALRVVSGFMGRKKVDDNALLTRLFVTFEGSSHLRNPEVMRRLLADSQRFLHRSLEGRVIANLNAGDKALRKVAREMTCKKTRWCSRWTPPQFLLLKCQWRKRATDAVMESRNASGGLLEQYAEIRTVLEWMTMKCMFTKSLLHHDLTMRMAEEYYHLPDFRSRVWQPEVVLNRFRSDGHNALAQTLQKMRKELDRWHAMLSDHLDSSKMK